MKLAIAGDIAFSGLVSIDCASNGSRFRWLEDKLAQSDGLIANLEAPVVADERNPGKKAFLAADPEVTRDLLRRLNVVCVSLANNHILDCGREGLASTIRLLDEAGIYHSGAGVTSEQAAPVLFTLAGKRVAFAAYTDRSTHPAKDSYPDLFLNIFDPGHVADEIRSLRGKADIVIVSIHWGIDYSFFHEPWQRNAAKRLAEAGADIVMGHHSHTLQPFERLDSTLVFYGLGGLIFGDFEKRGKMYALYRRTKHSAVFMLDEKCVISDVISTHEKKGNYVVDGRRDILKRNRRLLWLSSIRERSRFAAYLISFHEKVSSRVFEYFFGYYMNPFRRLFQFRNISKAGKLFR